VKQVEQHRRDRLMWNKFEKLNQKTNIGILHSQHQCWDAARGPGALPPASLESMLKVCVSEANLAQVHGLYFSYVITKQM
jgi:hypothetical protein